MNKTTREIQVIPKRQTTTIKLNSALVKVHIYLGRSTNYSDHKLRQTPNLCKPQFINSQIAQQRY